MVLIKWLRTNGWNTPILIYCGDMMKNLSWHASYPNILVASTQTQMDIFFQSMTQNLAEEKKEKKEKKEKNAKEEMDDDEETQSKKKEESQEPVLSTKITGNFRFFFKKKT